MNTFRQSFYLFKKNLRSIVGFEIVYRLFCIALMLPCVTACFQLSLRLAGYHYLSEDRIFSYLVRPTTIVILCFVLLLLSVITVFEIFLSDPGLSCLLSRTDHFPDRYAQPWALHIKKKYQAA